MLVRKYRSQWYAAVFANLSTFAFGIALGWAAPNIPRLQSTDTPLADKHVLDWNEISWVSSLYLVGGAVSSLFHGWTAERFGRKPTIILTAVSQTASWIIIEFGTNVYYLYLARFLVGFGGGGCYVTIPVYVNEIASEKIRGTLGAIIAVTLNLGIVVGYTINSYLDYYTVPFVVMTILVVFFVGFSFAADSPKHLMAQNKITQALSALKYFRGNDQQDFKTELQILEGQLAADTKSDNTKLTLKDFSCKSARKAIFIGVFINFLSIMNGIGAVNSYSWAIFQTTGSTLSPEDSTIMVGVSLLIGAIISILLNDRAGRRLLMGTSALGCGITLSITVVFLYLKERNQVSDGLAWIPLVCICLFMLIGAFGITSLHFSITSEVLAHKIRGIISSICLMENWLLAFLLVKFFPMTLDAIGMQGCMLIFATTCFSGVFFVVFMLPETKGKRIEAIIEELEK